MQIPVTRIARVVEGKSLDGGNAIVLVAETEAGEPLAVVLSLNLVPVAIAAAQSALRQAREERTANGSAGHPDVRTDFRPDKMGVHTDLGDEMRLTFRSDGFGLDLSIALPRAQLAELVATLEKGLAAPPAKPDTSKPFRPN